MSGDLQAKRKTNKNRSKKKSQLQELEKREYLEEASQLGVGEEETQIIEKKKDKNHQHRAPRRKEKMTSYSYTETEEYYDEDDLDGEYNDSPGGKAGMVAKCLFFVLLIVFLAVAGLSIGIEDYRNLVSPSTIKVFGSNEILPDFQGIQSHLHLETASKAFFAAKESIDESVMKPVFKSFENLVETVRGILNSHTDVHPNDDSEDYTDELNKWINPQEAVNEKNNEKIGEQVHQHHHHQTEEKIVSAIKETVEKIVEEPVKPTKAQKEQVHPQQNQPEVQQHVQQQQLPQGAGKDGVNKASVPTILTQPIEDKPTVVPIHPEIISSINQKPQEEPREAKEPPAIKATAYTLG